MRIIRSLVLILGTLASASTATGDALRKKVTAFLEKTLSKSECPLDPQVARYAGQPLIIGFEGTSLKPDLERKIRTLHPGGIIVFSKNIAGMEELKRLINDAQELSLRESGRRLLVAIDQEGGEVSRIRIDPPLPSALSIGLLGDPNVARNLGHYTGKVLNSLGINMNLAPVLDLAEPDESSFIGTRSYGADPNLVSLVASEYASGLLAHGVLPTFKHFPGHGNVIADSHQSQFRKHIGFARLMERDLVPFKYVFGQLPFSAVMSAHIGFPDFDSSGLPASFSPVILKDILRSVMEFKGLIVSDDLQMHGARISGDTGERAVRSLHAGADVLIFAWNYRDQLDAIAGIKSELCHNFAFAADQSAKVFRISRAVELSQRRKPRQDRVDHSAESYQRTIMSLYDRLISRGLDSLPIEDKMTSESKISILSSSITFLKEADQELDYPKRLILFDESTQASDVNRALKDRRSDLLLFYNSSRKTGALLRRLHRDLKRHTVVINTLHPARVLGMNNYLGVLQLGSQNRSIGRIVGHQLNNIALKRGIWTSRSKIGVSLETD